MSDEENITYGFLITALATSAKDPGQVIRAAIRKKQEGARVELFLTGDGVYLIRKGQSGPAYEAMSKALAIGMDIFVSADHLLAAGIPVDKLPEGVEPVRKPCRRIAIKTMEEWDKVIVC